MMLLALNVGLRRRNREVELAIVEHLRPQAAIDQRSNVLDEHAELVVRGRRCRLPSINGDGQRRRRFRSCSLSRSQTRESNQHPQRCQRFAQRSSRAPCGHLATLCQSRVHELSILRAPLPKHYCPKRGGFGLKSAWSNPMGVQVPLRAPKKQLKWKYGFR